LKINLSKLNIFHVFRDCKEYNLGLWECPSFVFFVIGLINIMVMVGTYFIANRYVEPEFVALLVLAVTAFIFIIGHFITQSFTKLAQANKMKTEFVSIASHQLRTPLAGVRWSLNLFDSGHLGQLTEEQKNFFVLIKEGNERMIRLVNDLLDVSRIEMGRVILVPRQTNLYILVEKIIKNFAPLCQASNMQIILDADETLPTVYSDPDKLYMVIQNLIDNAIKYSKGKGEVKITMKQEGRLIKTSIKDSGVGIPAKQQKFIFQKFFRSDNVMKYQTAGTGLGLFIAKSIIEQSKGKIWFESVEGQGTTFYFTLPIFK